MAIPVTLADARRQLRMEADDDSRDDDLNGFIDDAAAWVESYTGHILVTRIVEEQFVGFGRVQLRAWPVKPNAVPIVTFEDPAGAVIGITAVRVVSARRPARVVPSLGTHWPPVGRGIVTVSVRVGYEPGDVVPGNLRRAMLVLIAAYDADRAGGDLFQTAEKAARTLCSDQRARSL